MSESEKAAEEGECLLRPNAPPPVVMKPLLFYILMDASIIQEKKLRIPKKFTKKYRDKPSTLATLVVSSGDGWLVELREVDGNLWFTDGWHKFVVRNSICAGCLLVFKYEGDSTFEVSIFNLKSCEAGYTEKSPTSAGKEKQFSVSHGKESENVLDGDNCKVRPRSTRDVGVQFNGTVIDVKRFYKPVVLKPTETREKRNEPSNLVKEMEMPSTKNSTTKSDVASHMSNTRKERNEPSEMEMPSRKIPRTKSDDASRVSIPPERERTIRSAEEFKPSNPHCRIVMRPSFISNKILYVPTKFASEYLFGISEFVTLEDSNGKQWRCGCVTSRSTVKLSQGWSKFVKDKHLEEGDVCVFELMQKEEKKKNIVLKVTIFRVSSHMVTSDTKPQSEVQP